ncbi:MAG TPA: PAS domain-containing protein, partial [Gemmatimonadaceae bacterium]|nr:PAS domain-containing protein [Gemmatimonadaceae bacterium]
MSITGDTPRLPDPPTAILERISDGIVGLDRSWRYVYLNTQAGRLLGRSPESLLGKHIWTEFPDGVGQPFHLAYERAMSTGETIALEEYYPPFGRWFENRIYPSPEGLTIYFHDVTERRRAQDALRATAEDLLVTLQSVGEAVITTDASGRVRRLNPAAERMTQWRSTDAAGVELASVVSLLDAAPTDVEALLRSARHTAGR